MSKFRSRGKTKGAQKPIVSEVYPSDVKSVQAQHPTKPTGYDRNSVNRRPPAYSCGH